MNSGYLLDTNVVSALAPDREAEKNRLGGWLKRNAANRLLFLSVIVFMEVERESPDLSATAPRAVPTPTGNG